MSMFGGGSGNQRPPTYNLMGSQQSSSDPSNIGFTQLIRKEIEKKKPAKSATSSVFPTPAVPA